MTINQKNCGDSRTVRTLIEQVSDIQEDLALLDNKIEDLSGVKANKDDIAEEVTTKKISAIDAMVGEGTVNRLHSSEIDSNEVHSSELLTNYLEVNESADIANLKATVATIDEVEATGIYSTRITASEKIELKQDAFGPVLASIDYETDGRGNITSKVRSNVVESDSVNAGVTNATLLNVSEKATSKKLNVTDRLTVQNIDISGEITGLNNVDIDAKSIVTPVIEADEAKVGSIYTSEKNRLHPTPSLDNNDYYIVELPVFTGNIVLDWIDNNGVTVWSANVTGNGEDYSITWSTKDKDKLSITNLYQYNRHLYIKTNANGDLLYSYHATSKLATPGIGYNGVSGWTDSKSIDEVCEPNFKYECNDTKGTYIFGNFYAPSFTVSLDTIETNKIILEGEDLVNKHVTTGRIDENLIFRTVQWTADYGESAFDGLFYEVAPFMESEQIPEGAKLIYNDNGTLRFTDSLPPFSGLQFGSIESVEGNRNWFENISWLGETVQLADFTYSTPVIKVGSDREVATQGVQSFVDYRENATDELLDRRSAETALGLKNEIVRAMEAEEKKQDKLPEGEPGQVLTNKGDGTVSWEPALKFPVGMVVELDNVLNANDCFEGDWIIFEEEE